MSEDDTDTVAESAPNLPGEHFEAGGKARRNPADPERPVIGEEPAIARAVARLQHDLMGAARDKIDRFLVSG